MSEWIVTWLADFSMEANEKGGAHYDTVTSYIASWLQVGIGDTSILYFLRACITITFLVGAQVYSLI